MPLRWYSWYRSILWMRLGASKCFEGLKRIRRRVASWSRDVVLGPCHDHDCVFDFECVWALRSTSKHPNAFEDCHWNSSGNKGIADSRQLYWHKSTFNPTRPRSDSLCWSGHTPGCPGGSSWGDGSWSHNEQNGPIHLLQKSTDTQIWSRCEWDSRGSTCVKFAVPVILDQMIK